METIIIASTHLADIDDEQIPGAIKRVPAQENIDGTIYPAVNCWEISHNDDGTFTLGSDAPIDEYYTKTCFPATPYPSIIIDEKDARDLLAFLQAHLEPKQS